MKEKIYDNLWDLFMDAKACNTSVLVADDPRRLLIGWAMPDPDKAFYVQLSRIKARKALHLPFDTSENQKIEEKVGELLMTKDGRLQIANYLSGTGIIPEFAAIDKVMARYMALKAFW
jgi:hypothetical protein